MPRPGAIVATAALLASAGTTTMSSPSTNGGGSSNFCPEDPKLVDLDIDEVQDLLEKWHLSKAMGAELQEQRVDGYKLRLLALPGALDAATYPNAQPFDLFALKNHLADCLEGGGDAAGALAASKATGRRRRLAVDSDFKGILIKKDNGGIALGPDGDVSLVRSGDATLLVNASEVDVSGDLDVWGDLMVEGHLNLNTGNVSAANIDDLVESTTSLWSLLGELQAAQSSLTAVVSSNAADISDNAAAISSNAAAVSSNAAAISSNAADISDNGDLIAALTTNLAVVNATSLANEECCAAHDDDLAEL